MRKRIPLFMLIPILALKLLAFAQSSGGSSSNFAGLDVVILIDQSGSMWGLPVVHPEPNDKHGHRIGQTKNIIYRLAEHVENTPLVHRVSVIDFGDDASVAVSNHLISYNPSDPGAALRQTKSVIEHSVSPKAGKGWEYTNTPAGMALAIKEYEKMAASGTRGGRQRVMLIITDGRANARNSTPAQMQTDVRANAAELEKNGVGIWVVGFNDKDNYWMEGDGAFWESVSGAGRARLADTASSDIFGIVQQIVDQWLNTKSKSVAGDEYYCPPYLGRIVFNVNFGTPRIPISINDPAGNLIPISAGGPGSLPGTTARFEVADPVPGVYKIDKDSSRSYHVAVEEYPSEIKRLVPSGAGSLDAETRVVFEVRDGKGVPLQILSQWPIAASIVATSPSEQVEEIPASFEGDGKFQAKWKPSELGDYRMKLKGIVTLRDGTPYDVFKADGNSYTGTLAVNRLIPYRLRLVDPDPEGSLRVMSADTSSDIKLSLVDSKDSEVKNLQGLVNDPTMWLSLQLVDKSGAPLSDPPIPLRYDGSGSFEAAVPVKIDWKRGEGWWMPGHMSLRVISQQPMLGDNFLDSIRLPQEIETKRAGGDPMTVGPIDIRFSVILIALAILALLALSAVLLWYIFMRLLPGLLIWRADSSRRRTVELKIYNGAEDPNADFAKRYPVGTWDRFKYDRKIRISVDNQEYVAKKFRVRRAPSQDQVMTQVKYCWQNQPDKEYTVMLSKGRTERLRGLPGGEYLLALDSKQ